MRAVRARRGRPITRAAWFRDWSGHCLLSGAPVDALTQQIGVADVAGILLDQVDDDVARLGLLTVNVNRGVEVQVGVDGPGVCDLFVPGVPRFGDDLVISRGLVEV